MTVDWEKAWGHNELRLSRTICRQEQSVTDRNISQTSHPRFLEKYCQCKPHPLSSHFPELISRAQNSFIIRVHHGGVSWGCRFRGECHGVVQSRNKRSWSCAYYILHWSSQIMGCALTHNTHTLSHQSHKHSHTPHLSTHTPITHVPSHTQFSHSPRRWVAMWMRKTSTHSCSPKRESLPLYLETRRPHRQRWVWTMSCAEFRLQGLGLTTFVKWLFSTQSSFSSKCKLVCGKNSLSRVSLDLHCVSSVERTTEMSLISHWGTYFLTSF